MRTVRSVFRLESVIRFLQLFKRKCEHHTRRKVARIGWGWIAFTSNLKLSHQLGGGRRREERTKLKTPKRERNSSPLNSDNLATGMMSTFSAEQCICRYSSNQEPGCIALRCYGTRQGDVTLTISKRMRMLRFLRGAISCNRILIFSINWYKSFFEAFFNSIYLIRRIQLLHSIPRFLKYYVRTMHYRKARSFRISNTSNTRICFSSA